MNNRYRLSNVAKEYLNTFQCILDDMIDGMTKADITNSVSHNFIVQMIPHHRAAIEMSHNILRYTTDIPLQNIAEGIIQEQTKSIENMLDVKEHCSEKTDTERDVYMYQRRVDRILEVMFRSMENARTTNNINSDFIREMIPHHKGAIEMSQNALQYEICPELKPILYAIISSQQKGIMEMERLIFR